MKGAFYACLGFYPESDSGHEVAQRRHRQRPVRAGAGYILPLGRQRSVFPLRCDQDHGAAVLPDFRDLLYPELLSTGAEQADSGQVSRTVGQHNRRAAGHGDALLLLLLHPPVHRLYQCGAAVGCDLFLPDFLAYGGLGQSGAADEHLRGEGRRDLRHSGPGCCRSGRYAD